MEVLDGELAVLDFSCKAQVASSGTQARNTSKIHNAALVEAVHAIGLVFEAQRQHLAVANSAVDHLYHLETCRHVHTSIAVKYV